MAKYSNKLALEIAEIYGMGKATIEEICTRFDITKTTFFDWIKKKPYFSDSIELYKEQRRQNIGDMALNALELLLTKHEYTEEKIEYETYVDPVTKAEKQKVVSVSRTKKFIMPNQAMTKFALINAKKDEWKDSSHIDHTTKGESMGFGSFLQQTKPLTDDDKSVKPLIDVEEMEVYVPDHRE